MVKTTITSIFVIIKATKVGREAVTSLASFGGEKTNETHVKILLYDNLTVQCGAVIIIKNMMTIMAMTTMMTMVTQHIPTMTKSHHGGEMSVMTKVGMCQCQKPNTYNTSW